jgi:hypothetical protein
MIENGLTKSKAEALATFVHRFLREVDSAETDQLDKAMITGLYKQVILQRALDIQT